jgi:tyrosyl-tRNA synthetase
MSKSLGNTIDFEDPPSEKYGKIMSLPDGALLDYLELATDVAEEELAYIRRQLEERSVNPMEIKKRLAREIVAQFHGEAVATEEEAGWGRVFQQRDTTIAEPDHQLRLDLSSQEKWPLAKLLVDSGAVKSMSEARRLIRDGAVEVEGQPHTASVTSLRSGTTIRVGKHRFLRIVDSGQE